MDALIPKHLGELMYRQCFGDHEYCDLVLRTKNGILFAHSSVISLASLIFKRLIREAQVIENKRIIDLSDCDMASIQAVMEYIYTGRENFPLENRAQILKLASFLECQGILKCLLGQIREQHFGTRQNQPSPDSGHQSPEIKMEPQEDPGHVTLHRVIRLAQPNQSEGHGFCNSSAYSSPPHSEEDEDNSEERTKSDPDDIKQNEIDSRKYCKECKKSFATVGSYTRHLRMIHFKLKPLACAVCRHAFYQRSDLKKHVLRQHPHEAHVILGAEERSRMMANMGPPSLLNFSNESS